jgi:adenosylmethionine-8-amino-7-oxononanoate aminotransferase
MEFRDMQASAPKNNVFYRNQKWGYPKITHGKGIYLYDDSGKMYIDACAGSAVANIGHGNKEVAEYTKTQMETIAFTHLSRWTVDTIEQCAAKVCEWAPGDLNHVYFVSGGSESTETAIKMARQYFYERDGASSTKWKVISKWNSFHGNTLGALSMTGMGGRRQPYGPMLLDFPKIPQFYHYRNPWGCTTPAETAVKAAEALEEEILRQGPENISAFITEVVVGAACPGVNTEPVYFAKVRDICTKYDVLLIVDEVMSGFGRTGRAFASDYYGLVPDIMTCAKGMSCGYTPIGATIANDAIFETIMVKGRGEFVHGHTYAGNPLSCGVANKVMQIMERDHCFDNAAQQGVYLMEQLQDFYDYPIVGDIRGKGLMIGIELVKDQATKEPFPASQGIKGILTKACLEAGVVIYPGGGTADGVNGDHFLLAPPINVTREEIDLLLERLHTGMKLALKQISDRSPLWKS